MSLMRGYTVGDELGRILQLADENNPDHSLTYPECGELLEQKIRELFSYVPGIEGILAKVKRLVYNTGAVTPKDYCYGLAAAGVRLGRAFTPSSDYHQTPRP